MQKMQHNQQSQLNAAVSNQISKQQQQQQQQQQQNQVQVQQKNTCISINTQIQQNSDAVVAASNRVLSPNTSATIQAPPHPHSPPIPTQQQTNQTHSVIDIVHSPQRPNNDEGICFFLISNFKFTKK